MELQAMVAVQELVLENTPHLLSSTLGHWLELLLYKSRQATAMELRSIQRARSTHGDMGIVAKPVRAKWYGDRALKQNGFNS